MVAATKTKRLVSLGRIAETFQRSPGTIRAALDALDIAPAMELNDIGYYSDSDIDRIARRLRERSAATTIRPADQPHRPENLLR